MDDKVLEKLEIEKHKLETEIQDLWAFGKKSPSKERRLEEIKRITEYESLCSECKQLQKQAKYYKQLLKEFNVPCDLEGWKEC